MINTRPHALQPEHLDVLDTHNRASRWSEIVEAFGHRAPRQLDSRSSMEFWDWSLSTTTGEEVFSSGLLTMLGVAKTHLPLDEVIHKPEEPFWISFARMVTQCLDGANFINVYGTFTNAKNELVEVWALGQASVDRATRVDGVKVRFFRRNCGQ